MQALRESENTNYLVDEEWNPRVSTDYIRLDTDTGKIAQGGIFSLDGLHPTTIGYGLIANIYKSVMENQGVQFEKDLDRKSTRLNSSHVAISYAVFCLKKE